MSISKNLSFETPVETTIFGQGSWGSPWPEIVTTRYRRLSPPASRREGLRSQGARRWARCDERAHSAARPSHGVTGRSRLHPSTILLHTRCTTVRNVCLHALYFPLFQNARTRYQLTVSTVSRLSPNHAAFHVTPDSAMSTAVFNTSQHDTPTTI